MAAPALTLHESLMLLALDDRSGTVVGGTLYSYAVGGAVLAELILAGRVAADERRKKTYAEVVDRRPVGDPLAAEWLAQMAEAKRPRTLQDWVGRIAMTKDLKHRLALQLCRRGILRATEEEVLWIFSKKIYPQLDPGPERALLREVEDAVFGDAEVEPRTAVLVALADASGILKALLDKKRLKERKERLTAIAEGQACAKAAKEAIAAMQAAVMVATMVPAMVVVTAR